MKSKEILCAALWKLATEDAVAELKARAKAFEGTNAPKGLPGTASNCDCTDPDYPNKKDTPVDRGWSGVRTCTGTGGGPKL